MGCRIRFDFTLTTESTSEMMKYDFGDAFTSCEIKWYQKIAVISSSFQLVKASLISIPDIRHSLWLWEKNQLDSWCFASFNTSALVLLNLARNLHLYFCTAAFS